MFKLDGWRLLEIDGRDPVALLQGQTTCDWKNLPNTGGTGALCTRQGRVIANFGAALSHGKAYLSVPEDRCDPVAEALAKFLPFFGCELTVLETPGAGDREPHSNAIVIDLGQGWFENWGVEGQTDGWAKARIDAGLGWIDAASHETFTPQQLNLQALGAVSFTKGCYTGQEIVARTEHLGTVKKRLTRVTLSQPCEPTALMLNGRKDGFLLNTYGDTGLAVVSPTESEWTTEAGVGVAQNGLPYEIVSPIKKRTNQSV